MCKRTSVGGDHNKPVVFVADHGSAVDVHSGSAGYPASLSARVPACQSHRSDPRKAALSGDCQSRIGDSSDDDADPLINRNQALCDFHWTLDSELSSVVFMFLSHGRVGQLAWRLRTDQLDVQGYNPDSYRTPEKWGDDHETSALGDVFVVTCQRWTADDPLFTELERVCGWDTNDDGAADVENRWASWDSLHATPRCRRLRPDCHATTGYAVWSHEDGPRATNDDIPF